MAIFAKFLLKFSFVIVHIQSVYIFARTITREPTHSSHPFRTDFTPASEPCDVCPMNKICVQPIQCPAHVSKAFKNFTHNHVDIIICMLPNSKHGVCCGTGFNHSIPINLENESEARFFHRKFTHRHIRKLKRNEIEQIEIKAHGRYQEMIRNEQLRFDTINFGHPEFMHNMLFKAPRPIDDERTVKISQQAVEDVIASQIYRNQENVPIELFEYEIIDEKLTDSFCEKPQITCKEPTFKYRSKDGTCNNVDNPLWGSAGSTMQRLLPPAYEDGIWAPRMTSVTGRPLSSPRDVSVELFADVDRPHEYLNLMVMQFGQLIAHDITQSAVITLENVKSISCCSEDGSTILPPHLLHYACLPIQISPNDPFYSRFNQRCINFVRSSLVPHDDCKIGYAKQFSRVTHYLDGSFIYGSDAQTLHSLRTFTGGQMNVFDDFGRELLPLSTDPNSNCLTLARGSACFAAGDVRVNQVITLAALHTMFLREHNRVADILLRINPHWNDEVIFLETQRILVAEFQVIVYREWLPLIIGQDTMDRFELNLEKGKYSQDYSKDVKASITNEFSVAAFRFGHSIVDGKFHVERDSKIDEIIDIPDVMFNPARLRQVHFYDAITETLMFQPMQQVDDSITKGMTQYLLRNGNPFGLDIASLNIQRGRDHAIRSYNDYREASGHVRLSHFSEFQIDISRKLENVYEHPDDIDLWVGGLLERAVESAVVGSTFADIIADQFSRFRKGDRYFHEHNPSINPGAFTPHQLDEIRKVKLARIICDNADDAEHKWILPHAFKLPSKENEKTTCDNTAIPKVNFNFWRE